MCRGALHRRRRLARAMKTQLLTLSAFAMGAASLLAFVLVACASDTSASVDDPPVSSPLPDGAADATTDADAGPCDDCEHFPDTCEAGILCTHAVFTPNGEGGLDMRAQLDVVRGRSPNDVWAMALSALRPISTARRGPVRTWEVGRPFAHSGCGAEPRSRSGRSRASTRAALRSTSPTQPRRHRVAGRHAVPLYRRPIIMPPKYTSPPRGRLPAPTGSGAGRRRGTQERRAAFGGSGSRPPAPQRWRRESSPASARISRAVR